MTAGAWEQPVRRQKRRTRRDEIFEWVCRYADEMDGPTPSINEIAVHFKLNYKTVYYHVMKLIVEGRLRQDGESWSWSGASGSSRRRYRFSGSSTSELGAGPPKTRYPGRQL
jgi:hypothetical protein